MPTRVLALSSIRTTELHGRLPAVVHRGPKPVTHLEVEVEGQDGEVVLRGEAWCYTFAGNRA